MYFLCCSIYFCVVICIFVLFYVFLCCSMYCLFCVVLCIVCVHMCTVLLPPGGYPIAVKYIISHTVFELMMMGGVSPETCWAIKKHWNNKFYYTFASCWFFLWDFFFYLFLDQNLRINFLSLSVCFVNAGDVFVFLCLFSWLDEIIDDDEY
jgi:hypothetical protein